eukprot:CAMPEP_0172425310 /NCGR_PEP_ID=MMETSP1064-20121228/31423_1 /TAXON_ID=202472 /ORGANISM="Aulacoseira subarctica , Strain CCAP 1002/5" /LENGTH=228 /DNA_ID=CAMNT_0013168065 /DNA_START=228 /DNA_END=911 /DNA_ORIENTATION=-
MDAIDGNVRTYLCLPPRPSLWQRGPGNRSVYAAVQRAVAAQALIGWENFFLGFVSPHWEYAQKLYWEISGDYPARIPRSWTEGLLSALWECSHEIWLHRNSLRHRATAAEQASKLRARLETLVTDRYLYRPHLEDRYRWLFGIPLTTRLKEGNRALQVWLTSVSNLSSITTGLTQTDLRQHATFQRLSEASLGRLRRLHHVTGHVTSKSKFALGHPHPSSTQTLTTLW